MERLIAKILRITVVDPILVFTTLFPLIIVLETFNKTGIYANVLSFLSETIFRTDVLGLTMAQGIIIFYIFFGGIAVVLRTIFKNLNFSTTNLLIASTGVYAFITIMFTLDSGYNKSSMLFSLTFYLFNLFSIFALGVIKKAEKLPWIKNQE